MAGESLIVRTLVLLLALVLAACGGGGSSGGGSGTPPVANAGAAQSVLAGAVVTLDGSASSGSTGGALSYSWTITSKPVGSAVALTASNVAKPGFTVDIAGSYVVSLVVSNGQSASASASVTITALPTDTLTILTDVAEPLSGTVQLSLSGAVPGAQVNWYTDLTLLGTGTTMSWNAAAAGNGSHQLLARIQISPTLSVDVRRSVNVGNPSVSLSAEAIGTAGTPQMVAVTASSPFGVTSVTATLDGSSLGTLTSPNGCGRSTPCTPELKNYYQFTVNAVSGNHNMVVTATDGSGSKAQLNIVVPVTNSPVLTFVGPANGALINGSLLVSGTTSADQPGPVTVTATLGDVTILQTQDANFSLNYDISGLAAGHYIFTLQAAHATLGVTYLRRDVYVTSSAGLAVSPAAALPSGSWLLAMDGASLLYATNGNLHLLNPPSSSDVVLEQTDRIDTGGGNWQISAGEVYANGVDSSDCSATSCIYRWRSDGKRTNLSVGGPLPAGTQQSYPLVHDGHAIWLNSPTTGATLYDTPTGAYQLIAPPSGPGGMDGIDFAVTGGVVKVAFNRMNEVYLWSSDTGASTLLYNTGMYNYGVQTDGSRLAWKSSQTGLPSGATLRTQPVAGGAITTVATDVVSTAMLRDGVLAWEESTGPSVKASTGSAIATLATSVDAKLLGVGGGFAVFRTGGKTYSWNAATGQTKLLLEFQPAYLLVGGGTVYFLMDPGGLDAALYELTLQ
jgi:hypothetical protein